MFRVQLRIGTRNQFVGFFSGFRGDIKQLKIIYFFLFFTSSIYSRRRQTLDNMKLTLAVLGTLFCMAIAVPVPEPEESIDLVKIPLSGDKVSKASQTWQKNPSMAPQRRWHVKRRRVNSRRRSSLFVGMKVNGVFRIWLTCARALLSQTKTRPVGQHLFVIVMIIYSVPVVNTPHAFFSGLLFHGSHSLIIGLHKTREPNCLLDSACTDIPRRHSIICDSLANICVRQPSAHSKPGQIVC